jgi:GT2 family glycosyltransferase
VTIIIVNYNSWPDVTRLLSTLHREPAFRSGRFETVVVDNASQGPVPERFLYSSSPGFKLVDRRDNGGFAVGVNAGWRLARSPWLLVVNPDVEVEVGWIGQVIERIGQLERLPSGPPGIVGFGLRNPDGTPQGSVGVFPSLFRTLREQFIPRSRRKYQAGWRIRSGRVDWVTGACMLVNGRMIAELGGMDEDFFLYYEEVAFSRRAQDRGWRVEFDGAVSLVHRHPLQSRAVSPRIRIITRHSKLLYFRKHLPAWQFRALSWMVTAEAVIKGLAFRIGVNHEEMRAWETIRVIAQRMRAGDELKGPEVLKMAQAVELKSDGPCDHAVLRRRDESRAAGEERNLSPVLQSGPSSRPVDLHKQDSREGF